MILIVSTCNDPLSELEFVRPLAMIAKNHAIKHHSQLTPHDLESASKIIISGTALQDFEYLNGDFSWITTINKPILGICAGMHVIAKEYNIPLENFTTIGPRKVEVTATNPLAEGTFNAYFLHTKTGTGHFKTLAVTDKKPCMIKHPQKDIYGCIFHPEVFNIEVIRRFIQ